MPPLALEGIEMRRNLAFALSIVAAFGFCFASTAALGQGGYGGFDAYIVDLNENEQIQIRPDHAHGSGKVGVIPADAEGVRVIWCDLYDGTEWCNVEYEGINGWISDVGNLRNVDSGD